MEVNLKDLENFYLKISIRNLTTRGQQMKDSLEIVYKELMELAKYDHSGTLEHFNYLESVSLSLINKCR
jgi:hypothetical protein